MSGKPSSPQETPKNMPQKEFNVPVKLTDLSQYDEDYALIKEKFAAARRRVEEEMSKFSTDLMHLCGETSRVETGTLPLQSDIPASNWETLTSSPLVQGEGEDKTLKLQFDLSEFDSNEVKVQVLNDVLIVSAVHEENSSGTKIFREYKREFYLPKGIDPEGVVSYLSCEGVLTVEAQLPKLAVADTQAEDMPTCTEIDCINKTVDQ